MDAFGEIGVFVRVVERRSFTLAAQTLGLTASGVSRIVSRLEARLGTRLIERTTRSLGLTADGADYYERCTRILRDIEEADGAMARSPRGAPRGRLRVDAPTSFGRLVLAPALPAFLDAYPEVSLNLSLRDHLIDPIAEDFVLVASPAYLARRGRPAAPSDLAGHSTLAFLAGGQPLAWRSAGGAREGRDSRFVPTGRLQTNSLDALRLATLAGQGIACVLEPHVRDDIARGDLEVLLRDCTPAPIGIHALYPKQRATLPRVKVFVEFVEQAIRRQSLAPRAKMRR